MTPPPSRPDPGVSEESCHCGRPVAFGYDGDSTHHRGMCRECDAVRCDAYPVECPYPRGFVDTQTTKPPTLKPELESGRHIPR